MTKIFINTILLNLTLLLSGLFGWFFSWKAPNDLDLIVVSDSIAAKKRVADNFNLLAENALKNNNIKDAYKLAGEAQKIAIDIDYKMAIAKSYFYWGEVKQQQNELKSALTNYLKAKQIQDKELRENRIDRLLYYQTHLQIGIIYDKLRVYSKANDYFKEAFDIQRELIDKTIKATVLDFVASTYSKLEKYDTALYYYTDELILHKENGNQKAIIETQRQIIDNYLKKVKNYDKSKNDYNQIKQQAYRSALDENLRMLALQQVADASLENKNNDIYISLNDIGFLYQSLYEIENKKQYLDSSKIYHEQALSWNEKNQTSKKDKNSIISLINIAGIYTLGEKPSYSTANQYLQNALTIAQKNKDKAEEAQIYSYIANNYYGLQRYDDAIDAANLSLSAANLALEEAKQTKDAVKIQEANYLLAETNRRLSQIWEKRTDNRNDYQEALRSFQEYFKFFKNITQAQLDSLRASIDRKNQLDKTETDIEFEALENDVLSAEAKKKFADSVASAERVRRLEEEKKRQETEVIRQKLAREKAESDLRITQQSLANVQLREKNAKDSLENATKLEAAEEEKEKAERAKKDAETKQKLEKAEADKQAAEAKQREEIAEAQQLIYLIGFIFVSVIAALILLGLLNIRKKNKKLAEQQEEILEQNVEINEKNAELAQTNEEIATQRDMVELQKKEIEDINKHLTDSIFYAKNIQEAMLPKIEVINQSLPNSFVMFKPRDIVSGDFYWFHEIEDKIIITAVDCTGHGVPGAFMSMVGNDLLNEIVMAKHIYEPDKILNELHKGVAKALRQKETENRDGMDMTLCVIDKQTKTLSCAAAKNPLFYIKEGQIHELPSDKMPIGGEWTKDEVERIFSKNTLSLEGIDYFFMSSDGFPDQFGGPVGKKFMKGNMKKLFLEIYQKPPNEQQAILDKAITDWMFSEPQLDDILIIGFKP